MLYTNRVLSGLGPTWSGNVGFYKWGAGFTSKGFEESEENAMTALQPLLDWIASQVFTMA
jgi:hypothetical protein